MALFNLSLPPSSPLSRANSLRKAAGADVSETRTNQSQDAASASVAPKDNLVELDRVTLNEGLQGLADWPTEAQVEDIFASLERGESSEDLSNPSGAIQSLLAEILASSGDGLDAAMSPVSAAFAPAFLQSLQNNPAPRISAPSASVHSSDRLTEQLGRLRDLNPEEAERLASIAQVIRQLNPKGADHLLKQFSDFVEGLVDFRNSFGNVGRVEDPTYSSQPVIQITVETRIDARWEEAIVQLQDNGASVRHVSVEASQLTRLEITFGAQPVQQSDPLILDLNGDGIEISSVADGQKFDINGDGVADTTSFVRGGDAFLAEDENGNRAIDSGRELFGDQNGDANGFARLSQFDDNGDSRIDSNDTLYSRLRLLGDWNGDATVAPNELISLQQSGINSIDLNYRSINASDQRGSEASEVSSFQRIDGNRGRIVDVKLGYLAG